MSDDMTALIPKRLRIGVGKHNAWGDGACAMELAHYLDLRRQGKRVLRKTHLSDRPGCVCPTIGALMRSWNDALPDDDRDRIMRELAPLLLDPAGGAADAERRSWMALDWLVRVHAPAFLSLSPSLSKHADALRTLPAIDAGTVDAARPVIAAARDAARTAARDAARTAASDAARDAAWAALAPTVAELQVSAANLVRRMCAEGER